MHVATVQAWLPVSACCSGVCLVVSALRQSCTQGAIAPRARACSEEARDVRKALWDKAREAVKDVLRAWMQQHPGEDVPEEVFEHCQRVTLDIVRIRGPEAERMRQTATFARHAHLDMLRTEGPPQRPRSDEQWRTLFPRYPVADDGFLLCHELDDVDGIRGSLRMYGLCIVHVLTAAECEATVDGMFEELNSLRAARGITGLALDPRDASTWHKGNWPSASKFLVDRHALHRQGFANRCQPKVHRVFAAIFGEERLHVSVDKWGIARGAAVNPKWAVALKPHWDVSPWRYVEDTSKGLDPGYQGLIALTDQDLETGCHLSLPGCTHFMKQWCKERRLEKVGPKSSFRPAQDDPVLPYMQPIPLRRGEMLVWSVGQLHGSTASRSHDMRLVQYVRMYPAPEAGWSINYEGRDGMGCVGVLKRYLKKGELTEADIESFGLDRLGKRLLGLESWDAEA